MYKNLGTPELNLNIQFKYLNTQLFQIKYILKGQHKGPDQSDFNGTMLIYPVKILT